MSVLEIGAIVVIGQPPYFTMQTTFPSHKCFQLSFRSSVEDPVRRPAQIWRWVIFTRKCIHTCNLCIQSQTLIIRQKIFKQFLSFFFLLFLQNIHDPLNHCNNRISCLHVLFSVMVYLQDAEYIKQASEAWDEAIRIAESTSGWENCCQLWRIWCNAMLTL